MKRSAFPEAASSVQRPNLTSCLSRHTIQPNAPVLFMEAQVPAEKPSRSRLAGGTLKPNNLNNYAMSLTHGGPEERFVRALCEAEEE
jgi:hypothetical protein